MSPSQLTDAFLQKTAKSRFYNGPVRLKWQGLSIVPAVSDPPEVMRSFLTHMTPENIEMLATQRGLPLPLSESSKKAILAGLEASYDALVESWRRGVDSQQLIAIVTSISEAICRAEALMMSVMELPVIRNEVERIERIDSIRG